ncbi:MerR family transcriptional regulator [Dactylosporangium sucinum]|uniref:MerR family transcriptional regulator n=1 Tax=Dactylosporangium sucinum TaxID=1424081 RepID=A0A917UEJ1_9ACTN|nr:MerR family transcriptional regulator [Dactylosporangium sucinum]GGM87469.1 MerR family transcriptional regulator [Dactylosporangium sucinum]
MSSERLTIGGFARLCRLTVKRLRHYDEVGLLRPAEVDAATGYRFYHRSQVRDAMAIGLLRSLDVPLPAIAEILAGDDEGRAAVLAAERDRLERELARARRTVDALQRLLSEGLLQHDVRLTREPARRLLVARAVCAADDIGPAVAGCLGRVLAAGVPFAGPLWGLFPTELDGDLRVAAGAELPAGADAGGPPGLEVEELAATAAVVAVHSGPYEQLPLTYQSVFAWVHERGFVPAGVAREIYLTDPTTTEPDRLVTQLVVPVGEE